MITKARKKVNDFVEPPSSEDKTQESVTSWVERSVEDGKDKRKQQYGGKISCRGSPKKGRSSLRQRP
jgi:hypothetical protein